MNWYPPGDQQPRGSSKSVFAPVTTAPWTATCHTWLIVAFLRASHIFSEDLGWSGCKMNGWIVALWGPSKTRMKHDEHWKFDCMKKSFHKMCWYEYWIYSTYINAKGPWDVPMIPSRTNIPTKSSALSHSKGWVSWRRTPSNHLRKWLGKFCPEQPKTINSTDS